MTRFYVRFNQVEKDGSTYSDGLDDYDTEEEAERAIKDSKYQDEAALDWDKVESMSYWIDEE